MATITRRSAGWQVQIRKKGYPAVSKMFDRKPDAESWARMVESEMDRGQFTDRTEAEKTTLGEILSRYKAEVSASKRGFRAENSRINRFLRHPLANRFLSTLKSSDFAAYRDERLHEVSGTSVNKELNLVSLAIDTARREWDIHVDNPVKLIRRPKNNRPRERRVEADELKKLLGATNSAMLSAIITLAQETAMRRGEIANLRWEHVKLAERTLHIPQTKTDSPRTVPLSSRAAECLRKLPRRIDGYVFGMRADSITQAFERACERAAIRDLRFHDLRHEATSRLFELGLNPMQVSAITGHRTLEMLKRYTHIRANELVRLLP
jgi:integrase